MSLLPDMPAAVTAAIASYPGPAFKTFHAIRAVVLRAAASNPSVGPLTETLRWGEPAYLTEVTRSGSTLRIAWKPANPDHVGVYLNCRTTLVESLREIYPDSFLYEGNRALVVRLDAPLPTDPLDHCARLAQTYHLKRVEGLRRA